MTDWPAIALGDDCLHIFPWARLANTDVDFRLRVHVVGNLVVATTVVLMLFQIVSRENMMDVASVCDQISHPDLLGEKSAIVCMHLGCQEDVEVRAARHGGIEVLYQGHIPKSLGQFCSFDIVE